MGARRLIVGLTAVALLVSSCSSSKSNSEEPPVRGGVLKQGLVAVTSFDPAMAQSVSDRVLADELYDGLTAWDSNTLGPVPALAAWWESTDDKQKWTFHLRDGVKAANGEPLTAEDVKLSLEHLMRKTTASPSAELLRSIVGYDAFVNGPPTARIEGITVAGNDIEFRLDAPFGDFASLLGNPAFGIAHYTADGNPVSTGPFVMGVNEPGKAATLNKSNLVPTWLDGIQVTFYPNVDASYAAFENNELDWSPVPAAKAQEAGTKYGRHLFRPSLRTLYLSFNLQSPKFGDVRFREAINHAINRSAVVAKIGGDSRPLSRLVSDASQGSNGVGCADKCVYDPAVARDLLHQAFPDGKIPIINLDLSADAPFNADAIKQITDDLTAVGIPSVVANPPSSQFAPVTVSPDRGLFQTAWSAAYPMPSAFLTPLYLSNAPANVSGLKDMSIDQRLVAAELEKSPITRVNLYETIERDLLGVLAVAVPLATFPIDSVATANVRGLTPLPTGNFDAGDVWLSPKS